MSTQLSREVMKEWQFSGVGRIFGEDMELDSSPGLQNSAAQWVFGFIL